MKSITAQIIPKNTWPQYFNDFAKQYQGWNTTVETLAGKLGDQHNADGLPLQGISYDPTGSQAGDILVEVGDAGTPFETHLIHRPAAVRVAITQPGTETDLEIDSTEGATTLVRVRLRPALPPPDRNRR